MTLCKYCRRAVVSPERLEIGYEHCPHNDCVIAWRRERIETEGLSLVNPHKQGFFIVYKPEASVATGRNSGRSQAPG